MTSSGQLLWVVWPTQKRSVPENLCFDRMAESTSSWAPCAEAVAMGEAGSGVEAPPKESPRARRFADHGLLLKLVVSGSPSLHTLELIGNLWRVDTNSNCGNEEFVAER